MLESLRSERDASKAAELGAQDRVKVVSWHENESRLNLDTGFGS